MIGEKHLHALTHKGSADWYALIASKASPAKRSEPVWTAIHITHLKTYTYKT